jgi:iron complex transport system substrate-binding protein
MKLFFSFFKAFKIKPYSFLMSCLLISTLACENKPSTAIFSEDQLIPLEITYATTFKLYEHEDFYLLELLQPWPKASESRKVIFVKEGKSLADVPTSYTKIQLPIEKLIVTSTTHIPSLISLNMLDKWVGFPGLDYVSSKEARARINSKKVKEIGKNEGLNTEVILSLQPGLIMGFAVEGSNKSLNNLEKSGIPTLYNSDWLENHPLGKAEWIKVFGILDGKFEEASSIFTSIENSYNEAKQIASEARQKPSVISGAMHQDVWYMPYGNSWQGIFLKDANASYIYEHKEGNGSIATSFEKVFEQGKNADFWISPAQFYSYNQLLESNKHYQEFEAFKQKQVYGIAHKTGATGGVLYYELAPNRPDLVLKDLVKILHPEVALDHELFFFKALE